jgi:hypothetical protein
MPLQGKSRNQGVRSHLGPAVLLTDAFARQERQIEDISEQCDLERAVLSMNT